MIFWLVKNGKDWNPAIPLVKRIFLVPDHIWPKTIKGQPALTHVIRNYVLLLVVPPLCLWWVTHIVTKALRLKILPGQQLPLFPNPPTLHHEQTSVKFKSKLKHFYSIHCSWKSYLQSVYYVRPQCVNLLAPWRSEYDFKNAIFNLALLAGVSSNILIMPSDECHCSF